MKLVVAALRAIGRSLTNWLDPVCQDKKAAIFGEHAGMVIRFVPVVEPDGHVKDWVPDPVESEMAERIAGESAKRIAAQRATLVAGGKPPPDAPPSFSPIDVPGL